MKFHRTVQHGSQLGRKIGFPTLNFEVGDLNDAFSHGVHSAWVWINKKQYKGALYLGPKADGVIVLEVHVLDFDHQVYGDEVEVEVLQKIRDPHPFDSLEELKGAIAKDVGEVRKILDI